MRGASSPFAAEPRAGPRRASSASSTNDVRTSTRCGPRSRSRSLQRDRAGGVGPEARCRCRPRTRWTWLHFWRQLLSCDLLSRTHIQNDGHSTSTAQPLLRSERRRRSTSTAPQYLNSERRRRSSGVTERWLPRRHRQRGAGAAAAAQLGVLHDGGGARGAATLLPPRLAALP